MLRIGQFTDTFLPIVDGVGRVASAYSETLCKMGHQVTVVAPMNDTGYRGGYPFELLDFISSSVPGSKQYRVGNAPFDAHYVKRIRSIPLDIIHAHSPFTAGSEALRLAINRKLPLVASFHSKYYDDFLKATKSEMLAKAGVKLVVNYFKRCDEVWAVGSSTADVLRGYGFDGPVQVMPNGVAMREVDPDAVSEVERRFGLDGMPVILFVGQMDWKKNIRTVLEGCAMLKSSGRSFRLVFAGQGPDFREIQQKAEELSLGDRTVFAGHISDTKLLDGLYSRASVFAFPSLYDNAPMVLREAAVMGTPSVTVRGSCAAEVIRDGENGYLCENSPADLCRVVERIIGDPEEAKQIGLCARETIPVPWERIMETVVERYERLIALGKEGKLKKKTLPVLLKKQNYLPE